MNDEPTVPGRRLTRAEAKARTRQLLLEAAASAFASKGFAGASVEEIAEAAGFSIGAVYSNFGSKEELFLELSETYRSDLITEAAALVHEHGPGVGGLGRLLTRAADKDADFALLHSEFWAYAVRNPRVLDMVAARLNAPRRALEALVRADFAQPGAPPEATPEALATVVAALFDGLVRQRLLNPASVPEELFERALQWLFTGIRAAEESAAPAGQPEQKEESD
jgi:AcrR family transcriptional regulator